MTEQETLEKNCVKRHKYSSRQAWKNARKKLGIGASEAGCIMGCGFKTAADLWAEKTGKKEPKDLSDNERVKFGTEAEKYLRSLFKLMNPEYEVIYDGNTTILTREDNDFMFYSPDGEIRTADGHGLLEIKTATCLSSHDWAKWNNRIPDAYFWQITHGMYIANASFAIVFAMLRNKENDAELRTYVFDRNEKDIQVLVEKEKAFWECVKTNKLPPVTIPVK